MLHIDEGQLHALLDDALDSAEADTVREHIAACGECAVRYEDERAIRARANAILELARPLPSTIPPFETVLQRAQKSSASRPTVPGPMRLAWAATIVLALGIGWLSRDFAPRADLASRSSNASEAMADAAPQNAELPPPPPPPPAPAPAAEPSARNAAGIGAVTGAAAGASSVPPSVRQERVAVDAMSADQALKTQVQRAASNAAGQSAPLQAGQQAQGRLAELSEQRDTSAAARARELTAKTTAAAPPPVVAAPPPAPRWEYLDLAAAEQRIGATILIIPGLQVDSVAVSRAAAGYSVRILHRLPGDRLLELRQEPVVAAQILEGDRRRLESVADRAGFFTVNVVRGNLQLIGRAQLPADSIRALLNRAR